MKTATLAAIIFVVAANVLLFIDFDRLVPCVPVYTHGEVTSVRIDRYVRNGAAWTCDVRMEYAYKAWTVQSRKKDEYNAQDTMRGASADECMVWHACTPEANCPMVRMSYHERDHSRSSLNGAVCRDEPASPYAYFVLLIDAIAAIACLWAMASAAVDAGITC